LTNHCHGDNTLQSRKDRIFSDDIKGDLLLARKQKVGTVGETKGQYGGR